MRAVRMQAELTGDPSADLRRRVGGKALGLIRLVEEGLRVPPFFVLEPAAFDGRGALIGGVEEQVKDALGELGPGPYAVRSSAADEDGERASFAGQLESVLGARDLGEVLAAIASCRRSGDSDRVRAYRAAHGLAAAPMAVLVQRLVPATSAGVVFSATPEAPEHVLISASVGLGEGVVQGTADCDTWYVGRDGGVVARIESKGSALRAAGGRVEAVPIEPRQGGEPALKDGTISELAAIARRLEAKRGHPVDLEFAVEGERLWLLQLRPVTARIPRGRRRLWDNSNIVESFSGTTTPMTFSFASRCYSIVYQLFCRLMGVRDDVLRRRSEIFARMIGFVRGRVFYNLDAWYDALQLLPGFALTRRWMEQMMGVSEVAKDRAAPGGRLRAVFGILRLAAGLFWRALRLRGDARAFRREVDDALAATRDADFAAMDPLDMVELYAELERRLLWAWTPPLVNDFLLMVHHGVFRQLCARWGGAEAAGLANGLLCGEGLESAGPAEEAERAAAIVRGSPELRKLFEGAAPDAEILATMRGHPELSRWLSSYLDRFGDRCADELKLEVPSLRDRPEMLVAAIRACLRAPSAAASGANVRRGAEEQLLRQVRGLRRLALRFFLRRARYYLRERESLRFLRTRVFGLVRRMMQGAGIRLANAGALDRPDDVWFLTLDEVLGYLRGTAASWDLRGLARVRRAEHEAWGRAEAPAERFETFGAVPVNNAFCARPRPLAAEGGALAGVPCCPGQVEAAVRVLRDPNGAGSLRGEILAAERTDPGWVPLFPGISGLIIERGSVLSHSAVVARELGIPTIVGVRGLTGRVPDGARVRMDGSRGTVEVLP